MNKIVLAFVFCFSTFCATSQSDYEITIRLKDCKDTIAYLTYYQFDKNYIKDSCTQIKDGKIVFKGKGKLDKGIYSLISQKKSIYFDFFVDDDTQKLEFKNDLGAANIEGLTVVNSVRENEFLEYIKYINKQSKDFFDYKEGMKVLTKSDTIKLIGKQKELDEKIRAYESAFLEKNKGTYISDVLNLKIRKVLKEVPKASNGRPDSLAAYQYYKNHYWDDVDFKDDAIMRNPFFFPKMKEYFETVIVNRPDSVNVAIDKILDKTNPSNSLYKLMLVHLTYNYETSKIMGFDKVFVRIVDKYFKTGKAAGIYQDESVVAKIIERADKLRPLLIGTKAPDLFMTKSTDFTVLKKMGFENAKNSEELTKIYYANEATVTKMFLNLHSIKADYLILAFWDVDCGHCQKEIPKLLDVYNQLRKENKDVKVFSVYTLHEGEKYLKYIEENKLNEWINVYDGAHINKLADTYDVISTPVFFILDKNKVIKAKKIGVESIANIVKDIEKEYNTK